MQLHLVPVDVVWAILRVGQFHETSTTAAMVYSSTHPHLVDTRRRSWILHCIAYGTYEQIQAHWTPGIATQHR